MIKFTIIVVVALIIILCHKLYLYIKHFHKKYDDLKDKYEFGIREIERLNKQILICEKNEEEKIIAKELNKKRNNSIYSGKRALIGDYYDESYKNTMNVLRKMGMSVDVVLKGTDIVDKIKHGYKYDIIFTNNVYKEGYDGPSTLRQLKNIEGFNTPVIIHTVSENKRDYFINICKFDEYIVKPLNQEKAEKALYKFFSKNKKSTPVNKYKL